MSDIVTYIAAFVAELGAALYAKVYDPVAWLALIGALLLGSWTNPQRGWAFALGWGILCFAVLTLASVYYSSQVKRGDTSALACICVVGVVAGRLLGSLFSRRSVQHS